MDAKNLDTGSRDSATASCLPGEALVQNLDFDDSVLLQAEEGKEKRGMIQESFRNFVDRTLALQRGSPVKRFSLKHHIDGDSEMAYVCRWICDVVERGVFEVDLRIKTPQAEHFLPCQLFTSKTLVKLTLGTELYLGKLPSDAFLPSLNTLFIDTVFFEYGDLCDVLLAGCPVLEEVTVRHKDVAVPHTISSPTVKRLSVDYITGWYVDDGCLSLNLPNLVYLDYSGFALCEYPQADLDSLVEVNLDLHPLAKNNRPDITVLIAGMRRVEIFHLSRTSVDVISRCVKRGLLLPVFINLVSLSFGTHKERGWRLLKYLITQSPKLENLTIQDLNGYTGDVSMPLMNVKALHILGYRGTAQELNQLKSFLRNTECLEVLQVDAAEAMVGDDEIKSDIMMLLGLSVSSKCKIKVT